MNDHGVAAQIALLRERASAQHALGIMHIAGKEDQRTFAEQLGGQFNEALRERGPLVDADLTPEVLKDIGVGLSLYLQCRATVSGLNAPPRATRHRHTGIGERADRWPGFWISGPFRGLYLEVSPAAAKHWRWKFYYAGKEKRLAFGVYPEISLKAGVLFIRSNSNGCCKPHCDARSRAAHLQREFGFV